MTITIYPWLGFEPTTRRTKSLTSQRTRPLGHTTQSGEQQQQPKKTDIAESNNADISIHGHKISALNHKLYCRLFHFKENQKSVRFR